MLEVPTPLHTTANNNMSNNNRMESNNKRCCDCNCDCGQTLVSTFGEIVGEKLQEVYSEVSIQEKQMERIEGHLERVQLQLDKVEALLMSLVSIRYPELLKRKVGVGVGGMMELTTNDDEDDQNDTPKKRKRIYSHDISNKINTLLDPLFDESWKLNKDKEREIGVKLAEEINIEVSEGINIVKSFWHRSRGNSKRLFTQLDDYRQGLELIATFDPEKKREALNRFKLESEDIITNDLAALAKIIDDMKKKGSGRTNVKGKKNLRRIPDVPIKTLKGRATTLCNHFYALIAAQGNMEMLGRMEEYPSPSQSPVSSTPTPLSATTHQLLVGSMQQPLMTAMLNTQLSSLPLTPT